ncbi:hypothetical protein ACFC5X_16470 [Streptomyces sp. NPDC055952]|uniref:hypothetical protein n=1 Tax=Streptomyces sp. NPDC055952 TaxID=3345663 RepID=UPI0035DA547E
MTTRRACLAAVLLTTALALTGCGDADPGAGSVPGGWGTLRTDAVDVSYPKGWQEQSAAERGRHNVAAAVRTEGGRKVAVVTVQLGFTEAASAEQAAIAAEAGIQLGAKVRGQEDADLAGTDDAKRIDFSFTATGEDGGPAKGTPVEGVILTGLDSSGTAFAVRIDARRGSLPSGDLDRIVDSVEVH